MVGWTGAFWQVQVANCTDPNTGAALPPQALDRWFAPLPHGRAPDWFRTRSRYLDNWMPGVVTEYLEQDIHVSQTLFVTAPTSAVYGTVALVKLTNGSKGPRRARFSMAMGLRRIHGEQVTPFISDPLETGYRLDGDRQTVRAADGSVVLHAFQPGKAAGTGREFHLTNVVELKPGATEHLAYFVPDVTAPMKDQAALTGLSAERLLEEFRQYWLHRIGPAAQLVLPERRLAAALRNLLAQCMIIGLDGDQARYGAYHYESYFGLEEGWAAVALAQFGLPDYARKIMDYMLSDSNLDKANYHHQYRNGLAPWYAADVARLCPDAEWERRIAPTLRRCADWTIARLEDNRDPKWGGILPRHAYGGDIGLPAYSLYANATCWRGLHETALIMERLRDHEAAERYARAAGKYRARLTELADVLVDRSTGVPFLPMSFGIVVNGVEREKEPPYAVLASDVPYSDTWTYLGNYWNLFAPCFQELRLFPLGDERSRWVPQYMEHRGGICAGQVRFANGLDAVYGKGYIQSLLDSGRREEFLTSLYGLYAHAMSRNLYSNPEVSGIFPLRTSNLRTWWEYARERWFWSYRYGGAWAQGWQNQEGEPLAAGAGMAAQLLRMALVREDYAEDPPTALRLLDGVPAHWFEPGQSIAFEELPTFFGTVSLRVQATDHGVRARLSVSAGFSARRILLRITTPDGKPARRATVDGEPAQTDRDYVVLEGPWGEMSVEVAW